MRRWRVYASFGCETDEQADEVHRAMLAQMEDTDKPTLVRVPEAPLQDETIHPAGETAPTQASADDASAAPPAHNPTSAEVLAAVATDHAETTGHDVLLLEGHGWLCQWCDDDAAYRMGVAARRAKSEVRLVSGGRSQEMRR